MVVLSYLSPYPLVLTSSIYHTGKIKRGFKRVAFGVAGGDSVEGNQVFIKICTQAPQNAKEQIYDEYSHAAKVVWRRSSPSYFLSSSPPLTR
jgi:hypothetical protein